MVIDGIACQTVRADCLVLRWPEMAVYQRVFSDILTAHSVGLILWQAQAGAVADSSDAKLHSENPRNFT